jgi:hypothetical protein
VIGFQPQANPSDVRITFMIASDGAKKSKLTQRRLSNASVQIGVLVSAVRRGRILVAPGLRRVASVCRVLHSASQNP